MVTAASGHWVIAEHHQGNEVGHLQRPSWPPPQFHPERGIQGREKEEKGLRRHLDLNPKNRQEQTKGQTNYIAFWTSRNNVRGEPTEVKENRRREKTWGKASPSTNTDSVATAEVFCFEETLMLVWFTLSQFSIMSISPHEIHERNFIVHQVMSEQQLKHTPNVWHEILTFQQLESIVDMLLIDFLWILVSVFMRQQHTKLYHFCLSLPCTPPQDTLQYTNTP